MKFRLWTILWAFALLASAMATFGGWGIILWVIVTWLWIVAFTRPLRVLFEWMMAILAICFIAFLLWPVVQGRSYSPHTTCRSNLVQISKAVSLYEATNGHFPPAYQLGPDGKPWHSWRVLILPYLDAQSLYDEYSFSEPWDGPNNRKLWDKMPEVFQCPGFTMASQRGFFEGSNGLSNYFAVVGPNTIWRGSDLTQSTEIVDGFTNTILLIESSDSVCWLEPTDITIDQAIEQLTQQSDSGHCDVSDRFFTVRVTCCGRNIVFAAGNTYYIDNFLNRESIKSSLTINDGEQVGRSQEFRATRADDTCERRFAIKWRVVYPFVLFVCLSLLPAVRLFRKTPAVV